MLNETVCVYDEGCVADIFEAYTGNPFHVEEIDYWFTGDQVCRFEARQKEYKFI